MERGGKNGRPFKEGRRRRGGGGGNAGESRHGYTNRAGDGQGRNWVIFRGGRRFN